jgi:integrase
MANGHDTEAQKTGGGGRIGKISRPDYRAIDRLVRALPKPASGNKTYSEAELRRCGLTGPWVRGLAPRVTKADARAWVLRYRAGGIERLHTIGGIEAWPAEKVWVEAAKLRREIDGGGDPQGERQAKQDAPTVAALADRFEAEHLPRKRPATARDYRALLRDIIRPALGKIKVAELRHADVERMHHGIVKRAPYRANRAVAVLSKMLSMAVRWEMRPDNPARGIERAPEERRERYLTPAEIARLGEALAAHPERTSGNAVRMMLLTGARKGETLAAQWQDIDLAAGIWSKPAATTKSAKRHRVPLSAPALALLAAMKAEADKENARRERDGLEPITCLFPGPDSKPLQDVKHFWAAVCQKAALGQFVEKKDEAGKVIIKDEKPVMVWRSSARIHDLRHTYASILASAGLSLPVIGALLGHTQMQTTQRYSHLLDDPLRAATERAGAIIGSAGKAGADVVPIGGRRA